MVKIGLVGTKSYQSKLKVESTIASLKKLYGEELVIYGGGTTKGAEKFVRKFALEIGCTYRECNPAYTNRNLYSIMPSNYYGKQFHGSQILHRYFYLIDNVENLIIFVDKSENDKILTTLYKRAKKRNKKILIIT